MCLTFEAQISQIIFVSFLYTYIPVTSIRSSSLMRNIFHLSFESSDTYGFSLLNTTTVLDTSGAFRRFPPENHLARLGKAASRLPQPGRVSLDAGQDDPLLLAHAQLQHNPHAGGGHRLAQLADHHQQDPSPGGRLDQCECDEPDLRRRRR